MTTSVLSTFSKGDRPANTGPDAWLARRILAGWSPQAVALAGGISVRTAYRWISELERIEEVELGGFVAAFGIRRTKPPVRLEPWRRRR